MRKGRRLCESLLLADQEADWIWAERTIELGEGTMKQEKEGAPKVGFWRRAIAGFLVTLEKSLHWGREGGCPSLISSAPSTLLTSSLFLKVGRLAYQ